MDVQLEFRLPSAGDGALKAEIVEWFVAVGQRVDPGDLLVTVETEKSMVDLTAPFTGWVTRLGGEVGEMLEIGSVLVTASLDPPPGAGDAPTPVTAATGRSADDEPQIIDDDPPSAARSGQGTSDGDSARADSARRDGDDGSDGGPVVSPMVRRLAEEFGVDLRTLAGSGPDGRITRADVQRAAFGTVIGEPDPAEPAPVPLTTDTTISTPVDPDASDDILAGHHHPPPAHRPAAAPAEPLTPADLMPSTPAAAPSPSTRSVPAAAGGAGLARTGRASEPVVVPEAPFGHTLTLYREVEVEQLLRAHDRLHATIDGGLPVEALFMRLALPVLVEHPRMNARVDVEHQLVPADHYDVAFTCTGPRGLAAPVVRQVNDRSLRALGRAVADLATRAGQGRLRAGETGGQTFTVHNLGPLGVTAGTTTLPPGTAALVSYGQPRPSLRLVAGAPREVPVMTVGVTVDHRLVDDGEAARFLAKIGLYLEEPILAFTD